MSAASKWRVVLAGLLAGGFLAVFVPGTLVTRALSDRARMEEARLGRILARNLLHSRSNALQIRIADLQAHPILSAAPCSRPPGDGAWSDWTDKVAASSGAPEVRVIGRQNRLVASRAHPGAFDVDLAPPRGCEIPGLALLPLDPSRPELSAGWSFAIPLPNCPWLVVDLVWPWDRASGRVAEADSFPPSTSGDGVLWLLGSDGGPPLGVAVPEAEDRSPAEQGAGARMIIPAIFGGVLVLLFGWILLLPMRREWERVEREVHGAWRRMKGLPDVKAPAGGGESMESLLRALSEETVALAGRTERLAEVAGWKDIGRAVGHEVRNALTPLRLTVGTLAMRNRDDPRMMLGLEAAQDALARVQRLVEEFSNFARLPQANLKAADFETLARRSTDPWSQAGPPEVTVSPPRDRVVVTVDGDLFDHVAQNLLKNAREAAGPGGEVEVTIEALDGWGRMTVRNTGEPIPESHLERLFEGGLTTKPTGLGLGLSIAQELTRRMNGRIWAENLPAGGVAFHAEFPSPPGAE